MVRKLDKRMILNRIGRALARYADLEVNYEEGNSIKVRQVGTKLPVWHVVLRRHSR